MAARRWLVAGNRIGTACNTWAESLNKNQRVTTTISCRKSRPQNHRMAASLWKGGTNKYSRVSGPQQKVMLTLSKCNAQKTWLRKKGKMLPAKRKCYLLHTVILLWLSLSSSKIRFPNNRESSQSNELNSYNFNMSEIKSKLNYYLPYWVYFILVKFV